jgi:hypothetical protein
VIWNPYITLGSLVCPISSQSGFGREVANLSKLYTEESKYGGEGDNFEFKLYDACKKTDIPPDGKSVAEGKIDALSFRRDTSFLASIIEDCEV